MSDEACAHITSIQHVRRAQHRACEACVKIGASWVHLRMCMVCEHVGCCDNSHNKHATAHFHSTAHPIVRSREPGENWFWCYDDEVAFELEGS